MKFIFKTKTENAFLIEESISMYDIDGFEVIGLVNDSDGFWYVDEFDLTDKKQEEVTFKVFATLNTIKEIQEKYKDIIYDTKIEEESDENWNQKWIDSYKPVEVGAFIIVAPWHDIQSDKERVIIEPAMAFGTGYHETTSTCIEALEKYLKEGDTLYDVGAGSAILSIIAKKFGAKKVIGIEIDADAIKNAKENIELNNSIGVTIKEGNLLKDENEKADIIIANILPVILKDMVQDAMRLLNSNGYIILSGILNERVEEVKAYYSDFKFVEKINKNEWNTLIFVKE